jgi:CRISPR-associated protein Csx17
VNEALMAVADVDEATPHHYMAVLGATADVEAVVHRNDLLREQVRPVPYLDPASWMQILDDGSDEFAVAWSIASMSEAPHDSRRRAGLEASFGTVWRPSMRSYLRGVGSGKWPIWAEGPAVAVDPRRTLVDTLRGIHVAHATNPRTIEGVAGAITVMSEVTWLAGSTVEAFAAGLLDERRIGQLVHILSLLGPGEGRHTALVARVASVPTAVVPAWRLLAPVFHGVPERGIDLTVDRDWPSALSRGAVEPTIRGAMSRLRSRAGPLRRLDPATLARHVDPAHLVAALLLAPSPRTLSGLLDSFVINQEEKSHD